MESQENEFEVVEYMLKKLSNTFYSHIPTFLLKNKSGFINFCFAQY